MSWSSSSTSQSSSSSGSTAGPKHKEWGKETDDQVRGCRIKLSRRCVGWPAYHWCMTFMWDDGYQATYEALEYEGNLTPRWKIGGPENCSDDCEIVYLWYDWGAYSAKKCSPLVVNVIAKTMRIGDMKYTVLNVNCHEWAKALAWQFDVYPPAGFAKWVRFGTSPTVTFNENEVPENAKKPGMFGQLRDVVGHGIGKLLTNN